LYIVKYIIPNAEFETPSLFYMTTHKNISRLSAFLHKKHKMTICSKHLGRGHGPLGSPGYAYGYDKQTFINH